MAGPAARVGINSHAPDAAINAVDRRTGVITGAVMSSRNGQPFVRRHVGYYVNDRTLLWVANEGGGRYSCFVEHRATGGDYLIVGLQFNWSARAAALSSPNVMGGRYTRPQIP